MGELINNSDTIPNKNTDTLECDWCIYHEDATFEGVDFDRFIQYLTRQLNKGIQSSKINRFVQLLIQFDINRHGELCNIDFIETSGNEDIDIKIHDILLNSPQLWSPAKAYGRSIDTKYTLYIRIDDNHNITIKQ
jgi:hypothetical protein